MKCPSCNASIPSDSDICPACFSPVQVAPEPLAPPPPAATRANPREGRNRPETSRKQPEGQQCTPLSENVTERNVEGRFPRQVPKKSLFLVIGILAVIAGILAGYVVLGNRQAPVPTPPVAQEQASTPPAPEKPAEEKPSPAPEKPAEAKPVPPVQEKKTVKKVPKVQAPAPTPKWTYRPDPQPGKPAPAPQASKKSGIAGWLDKALGPEKPVTPPPAVNDARGTGM